MTIASELTALQQDITNARTAITNKGGTVTASGGSSQLATDIATIPTGGNLYTTTIKNNGTVYTPHLKQCDGISSTGIGEIDTGVACFNKYFYVKKCVFKLLKYPPVGIMGVPIFCDNLTEQGVYEGRSFSLYVRKGSLYISNGDDYTSNQLTLTEHIELNRWYEVTSVKSGNNHIVSLDGVVIGTIPISKRSNYNIKLFGDPSKNAYSDSIIKELEIRDTSDNVIINFVPMKSVDDNSAWYYNTANGNLFELQESFTGGNFVQGGLELDEYDGFETPVTVDVIGTNKRVNGIAGRPNLFISGTTTIDGSSYYPKNYLYAYKFAYSTIQSISFTDLQSISGSYSTNIFNNIFYNSTVYRVNFNELTDINAGSAFNEFSTYSKSNFATYFYKLKNISPANAVDNAFKKCNPYFFNLDETSNINISNMFAGSTDSKSVHFQPSNIALPAIQAAIAVNFGNSYTNYVYYDLGAQLNFTSTPSDCVEYLYGYAVNNHSGYVDANKASSYLIYSPSLSIIYKGTENAMPLYDIKSVTNDLTQVQNNKITLSTNLSDREPIFTIDNVNFNATAEGNSYYINEAIGTGETINYKIDGGYIYNDVSGTITTTGNDITIPITISEATYSTFTRPNLTENGTLGGDAFAVAASVTQNINYAWKAVDGNTSTYWGTSNTTDLWYTFYNPKYLKVSALGFRWTSTSYRATQVIVEGSNDNTNWTTIGTYALESTTTPSITIDSAIGYKYHRLTFTKSGTYLRMSELTITAMEKQ